MADVKLLRKLIEHRRVRVPVLLDHADHQRDQLMPEIEVLQRRSLFVVRLAALLLLDLKLAVVQLDAVVEQELVGGLKAILGALLHHGAGSRRRAQFLHFHSKKGDRREQIDGGLQVLQFLGAGGRKVVSVHGQVDSQRVVQLVEQLNEFLLAEVGGGESIGCGHSAGRRRMRIVGIYVGQ